MFRLVASVLVVLDRTFDDAEEVREFSPRYLAGFCEFRQASRRRGDTCSRFRCAFIIPSRASMCTALRSRERSCFLVVQTLWAEKIQSTTDAGSLNTFGRNEIEVAPISSALLRIACLVILYKTCRVPDQELAADGVSGGTSHPKYFSRFRQSCVDVRRPIQQ